MKVRVLYNHVNYRDKKTFRGSSKKDYLNTKTDGDLLRASGRYQEKIIFDQDERDFNKSGRVLPRSTLYSPRGRPIYQAHIGGGTQVARTQGVKMNIL